MRYQISPLRNTQSNPLQPEQQEASIAKQQELEFHRLYDNDDIAVQIALGLVELLDGMTRRDSRGGSSLKSYR